MMVGCVKRKAFFHFEKNFMKKSNFSLHSKEFLFEGKNLPLASLTCFAAHMAIINLIGQCQTFLDPHDF